LHERHRGAAGDEKKAPDDEGSAEHDGEPSIAYAIVRTHI